MNQTCDVINFKIERGDKSVIELLFTVRNVSISNLQNNFLIETRFRLYKEALILIWVAVSIAPWHCFYGVIDYVYFHVNIYLTVLKVSLVAFVLVKSKVIALLNYRSEKYYRNTLFVQAPWIGDSRIGGFVYCLFINLLLSKNNLR